jgi:hypothetical protein
MYDILHVKYLLFFSDFTDILIFRQMLAKHTNIRFNEVPSIGSRVVPFGQNDVRTDVQTEMTKLIVSFRNFANVPKTDLT